MFAIYLYIAVLLKALAPWIAAVTVAGVVAYYLAREGRKYFYSWLAVALVGGLGAAMVVPLPEWRARQIDNLRYEEAVDFCSAHPVRVLKPLPAGGHLKFGIYGSYLGPGDYKKLDLELRSRRTDPGSTLAGIELVQLEPGTEAPADVYPVFRRSTGNSQTLSVIEPSTGELIAYSNYLWGQDGETRFHYVGCDRQPDPRTPGADLQTTELFRLLGSLVDRTGAGGAGLEAKREFDIQARAPLLVRDDCSRGLTLAPGLRYSLEYRYLRDADDLVVVVLDRKSWEAAVADRRKLALENRAPIMWQHFHPAVICKGYFADDEKAGPVFHPGGYEEPVARVRSFGKMMYSPFDYGPHRKVQCKAPIVTGTVRPGWYYVLRRQGNDLVLADYSTPFGMPILVTPLITCAGYFDPASGPAPDVRLGAGGSTKEVDFSAEEILRLPDGGHLGAGPRDLAESMRKSAQVYASKPETIQPRRAKSSDQRILLKGTEARWPAKPRSGG